MTEEKKKEIRNMLVVQWVGGVGLVNGRGAQNITPPVSTRILVAPTIQNVFCIFS